MDGCREGGRDGWMKGRKEGRERWMDGWGLSIETRVYLYQCQVQQILTKINISQNILTLVNFRHIFFRGPLGTLNS
jgi:hypothetical protein